MDLRSPLHLGGGRYLEAVSVGADPSGGVHDCPACGGYLHADEVHLAATVYDRRRDRRDEFLHCDDRCLNGWLRTFPGT